MRKLLIASAIAVAATLSLGTASQAAGITVQLGDGGYYHHHRHWHHRPYYDSSRYWRHHRRCHTEEVIRWHHGRRYVEDYRVCR